MQAIFLKRFVRRQQSFIAIAVVIYAVLWAADRGPEIGATLAYTLPLGNLIILVEDHLGFFYRQKPRLQSWSIYVGLVFLIAILGAAIVNVLRFPFQNDPSQSLWQYLKSGWKIPFTATMIVGVSVELYRRMRERLESRNSELRMNLERAAAEREGYERELQQAREIQQSLLPKVIPQVPGFEIDGTWEPAREVGGDYYDVIRLSESRLGICIADVVGKSVSAALLMASVQATVRAFATEVLSPAALCTRVNSVLCSTISAGKFVTLLYGVLDGQSKTFSYCNAGHVSPIRMRAHESAERLPDGGAVLGVFPDWKYRDSKIELSPGDRLLLLTDGITEAGTEGGQEFGEARLISSALDNAARSIGDLKQILLREAKCFSASPLRDDATLIVIAAKEAKENRQTSDIRDVVSVRT